MSSKHILGIDFGGSGIKGAPVNVLSGMLTAERFRIPTPDPSVPEDVTKVIAEIVEHFNWKGPVGVGFPAVVQSGVVKTASNIDKSWIGVNAEELFSEAMGLPFKVVNDADSAGLAEMSFGVGRKFKGLTILVTVGTGIGSALFTGKHLVPNTELGHIFLKNGVEGEDYAADSIRQSEDLDWLQWGERFNEYLLELERLYWPDLIIIGGGVSKRSEKYIEAIKIKTRLEMASLRNEAGLIGAAVAAKSFVKKKK